MVQVALTGKSNTGKTTFFSAATLVDAEISNRIFTTIHPNRGMSYVRAECPCKELDVECNPQNSKCINGTRLVPVKLIDIAGLVPDAHQGRGLGNKFLSDIMEADALIHIVDASGGTDKDGNPVKTGTQNPVEDVKFFEREINYWMLGLLEKNWDRIKRKAKDTNKKLDTLLFEQLSGLKVSPEDVKQARKETELNRESKKEKRMEFVKLLREKSKPIIVAANKMDVPEAEENLKKLKKVERQEVIPTCSEAELALRRAADRGLIKYTSGDRDFEIVGEMQEKQKKGLEFIRDKVLDKFGSTGVQNVLNSAIFDLLEMLVVYPVASISKYSDTKGNILPDAHLVKKGTTLKEFAGKVHSEIEEAFVGGLNTDRRKLGADYKLKNGDVVEILFKK